MADRKISDLTALTAPASGDYLPIVDISEAAAASKNKRITIEELFRGVPLGTAAAPSIAIEGDEDTGVYSPGANQLAISTNGTGRLFVDASGNVGIAGSPANYVGYPNLRLNGTSGGILDFSTNGTSVFRLTGDTGGAFYYTQNTSYPHVWGQASSERMRLTSTGLGVGTSTPGSFNSAANQLVVGGGSGSQGVTIYTGNGVGDQGSIFFADGTTGGAQQAAGYIYYAHNTDSMVLGTANTPRVTLDSSGRLGVGTTSPGQALEVAGNGVFTGGVSGQGAYIYRDGATGGGVYSSQSGSVVIAAPGANYIDFQTNSSSRARIDSSGRLLVGISSARSNFFNSSSYSPALQLEGANDQGRLLSIVGSNSGGAGGVLILASQKSGGAGGNTIVTDGGQLGLVSFQGSDGTEFVEAARIQVEVDGTPGANDMPGRIVLSTTADGASSPTERFRINAAGQTMIGGGDQEANGSITVYPNNSNGGAQAVWNRASSTGGTTAFNFKNGGTQVGTVVYNNSSTAYNTSSDYRLKENVTAVTDGITRLQQLKPSRFNFITDPDKTVDGFIAHEVQDIVPEAITGEKDAVDDDGNPIYQGIDQSKLVPLLTAALQEAVARIETLEAKVAALEA